MKQDKRGITILKWSKSIEMRWTITILHNDPVESSCWVLVLFVSVNLPASVLCCLPYLGFLYGGVVFVTHGTDLHALVPLSVSLGKEFHHDAVCPLSVKLQWFGRVAQVSTVDHVLQNLEGRHSVRHTSGWFSFFRCALFSKPHQQLLEVAKTWVM